MLIAVPEKDIELAAQYLKNLIDIHNSYKKRLGYSVEEYTFDEAVRYLKRKDRCCRFIKHREYGIVGLVIYSYRRSSLDGECLYINRLYLEEEYRGKGIGTQVIDKIVSSTVIPVELSCYFELEAHEFYKKLGFTPIKTVYRR